MIQSKERPVKMLVTKGRYVIHVTANLGVTEVDEGYEYEPIHLQMADSPTYDTLITALIRYKYSSDAMEAIINNYLYEATEKAKEEFAAMQAWRNEVKSFAKEVFEEEV